MFGKIQNQKNTGDRIFNLLNSDCQLLPKIAVFSCSLSDQGCASPVPAAGPVTCPCAMSPALPTLSPGYILLPIITQGARKSNGADGAYNGRLGNKGSINIHLPVSLKQ